LFENGILCGNTASNDVINNFASIFGYSSGIAASTAAHIVNRGTIAGNHIGIDVSGPLVTINNLAGATIKGDLVGISAGDSMSLTNGGSIIGGISCFGGIGETDHLVNHGRIVGTVTLDGGNDTFIGTGGTSGGIFCGAGNDRVVAGNGNVRIHAGTGSDTLTGGPGADQFLFENALSGQVARITNFKPGVDKIVLSAADFAGIAPVGHLLPASELGIGTHAATHAEHIIYNPNNGFLLYDPDGRGGAPAVHFATLGAHLAIASTDFLIEA
jgi:Ca2+-binding RTX toxin-like protein